MWQASSWISSSIGSIDTIYGQNLRAIWPVYCRKVRLQHIKRVWCKFSGCNLPPLAHDFFFFLFTNYPYFIYIFGKWMPFLGKNVFCRALPYQKNIFLKIISPNNRGCSVKTTVVCAELLKLLHTQCGCALSLLWVCWLDCCAADNTQPSPAKLNFSDKVTAATSNKCVN